MKRIILAFSLLLGALIYLVMRISVNTLTLKDVSLDVTNPVTFNGLNIGIKTNIVENSQESIYYISMIPIYLLILISIILLIGGLKRKK